jgi:hypothetical protein
VIAPITFPTATCTAVWRHGRWGGKLPNTLELQCCQAGRGSVTKTLKHVPCGPVRQLYTCVTSLLHSDSKVFTACWLS